MEQKFVEFLNWYRNSVDADKVKIARFCEGIKSIHYHSQELDRLGKQMVAEALKEKEY